MFRRSPPLSILPPLNFMRLARLSSYQRTPESINRMRPKAGSGSTLCIQNSRSSCGQMPREGESRGHFCSSGDQVENLPLGVAYLAAVVLLWVSASELIQYIQDTVLFQLLTACDRGPRLNQQKNHRGSPRLPFSPPGRLCSSASI